MKVIAVYHHPQECGEPYVAVISQKTGKIIKIIRIPEGYYFSGMEEVETLTPVKVFTEKVCQSCFPTVENVRISKLNPDRLVFRPIRVENIQEDTMDIGWQFRTWTADVVVEACTQDVKYVYNKEKDEFINQMKEDGYDVSEWEFEKRNNTYILDFIKELLSREYDVINVLEIG